MRSLINKLGGWPPNYHKTARSFPKSSVPTRSMNKRARNNSSVTRRKLPCWLFVSLLLKILWISKYASWNILLEKELKLTKEIGTKNWKNQKLRTFQLNISIRLEGTLDDYLCSAILWLVILDWRHYQKLSNWLPCLSQANKVRIRDHDTWFAGPATYLWVVTEQITKRFFKITLIHSPLTVLRFVELSGWFGPKLHSSFFGNSLFW